MLISENEILQLLSQKLKSKRLEHSVNVAKRAEYLAELYQYDKRKKRFLSKNDRKEKDKESGDYEKWQKKYKKTKKR